MTASESSLSGNENISGHVNRSLAWVGTASAAVAGLDMLAHFLIAALWISPEELGVAVYAISLFPVLDLATDLGLAAAIVQRDDHTPSKLSTLFWLNLFMSLFLFALLAVGIGPLLVWIYDRPILASLLMVYGGKLLWQNIYYIPYSLMKKQLRFKELSLIRMLANVAEFAGKVTTAALGFGVWCYVVGPISRVIVTGIGVQICHPWRPRFVLRIREAMDWVYFGIKASAYKILFYLYTNVDYHVVGYFFGEQASGLYYNAYLIVLEPCRFISEVVQNIAFPVFSRLKNDREGLIEQFTILTRMNLVVILGFLGLLFVSAEDLLLLALGPEWTPAAPAVQILCAVGVLRALSFVIPPLLDGTNHVGRSLIYTVIAAVILPSMFFASAALLGDELGYLSVAWAWSVGYPIAFLALLLMGLDILELPLAHYLRSTGGIFAAAGVACGLGAGLQYLTQPWPTGLRMALVMTTSLLVFGLLLARFEGITPRAVMRSMRK